MVGGCLTDYYFSTLQGLHGLQYLLRGLFWESETRYVSTYIYIPLMSTTRGISWVYTMCTEYRLVM
jgi:hypothetical protein